MAEIVIGILGLGLATVGLRGVMLRRRDFLMLDMERKKKLIEAMEKLDDLVVYEKDHSFV